MAVTCNAIVTQCHTIGTDRLQEQRHDGTVVALSRSGTIDRTIARLADQQYGVVTREQLLTAGISDRSIRLRVHHGRLRVVHRGVYTTSRGQLSHDAQVTAALLACGPSAAVSHLTAANEWEMSRFPATGVDILLPHARRSELLGVQLHRARDLPKTHVTRRRGRPITTVSRTILDLSIELTPWQLANVMNKAQFHRRLRTNTLETFARRYRSRRGGTHLRRALALYYAGSAGTKSGAEDAALARILESDLPEPLVNVRTAFGRGGFELDFQWRDHKLNLEVDGSGGHGQPGRKQADAIQDRAVRSAGWTVIRMDAQLVFDRPHLITRFVGAALDGIILPSTPGVACSRITPAG